MTEPTELPKWTCVRCGHHSYSDFGKWWHTYLAWRWWLPWDKSQPRKCL